MVLVCLRHCLANSNSVFPYQFEVDETATIGEVCNMIIAKNYEWWKKGNTRSYYTIVKICGDNNEFFEDTHIIGSCLSNSSYSSYHSENKCCLIFDAV